MQDELPNDLGRRVGDLDELPDELRRQLQIAKVGAQEQMIIGVLDRQFDGIANVDEILVGVYRATGEVWQRQFLANKLYRMSVAKLLESVPKKKGVYRTKSAKTGGSP